MGLFRSSGRLFVAVAMAAQLSAPVLAANAKTLNLFCPTQARHHHEADVHAVHAAHADAGFSAHERAHGGAAQDEPVHERNVFDLSCCSVHLTGVMPSLSASFTGLPAGLQAVSADDPVASFPGMADPPPRSFV